MLNIQGEAHIITLSEFNMEHTLEFIRWIVCLGAGAMAFAAYYFIQRPIIHSHALHRDNRILALCCAVALAIASMMWLTFLAGMMQ